MPPIISQSARHPKLRKFKPYDYGSDPITIAWEDAIGAWLTGHCKDDKQVKTYLKWRLPYSPAFLELKIAVVSGKPNLAGALKRLAELAKQHGSTLSWKLRNSN